MGTIHKGFSLYISYGLIHVVVKLLRSVLKKKHMLKAIEGIPRARYKDSLMGAIPQLLKHLHRRHDFFAEITSGSPTSYVEPGPKFDCEALEIFVRDPIVVKHILKDSFDRYSKPEGDMVWEILRIWLGKGIFVAPHGVGASDKGHNWMRQRKVAANIFSRNNFNANMSAVFVTKGKRMCEILRHCAVKGEQLDMQAKFFQYTMDSIMQIFFGESADTMGGEPNKYASASDTAHRCLIEYLFKSIPVLATTKLLPWPFGGVGGLAHRFHRRFHPLHQEFLKAWQMLDSESRRMVAACRADARLAERKDLLALFVQAEEKDQSMTTEWLRDVVLNLVIAGRDTTACTLSWMFYILATHPEIQHKLQQEIDEKFDARLAPTLQSMSASELPYLNGVIYETLRLYPPVPADQKGCSNDDVLPDGTKVIAGTKVVVAVYAMGRDAKVYPDPEVVRPERWIPFKEPSQFEFPVFQAGPRVCLGVNMAVFEAKIAAAMILREYSFDMSPAEAEKVTYLPTALTLSICNTKNGDAAVEKFDNHNLWLQPRLRDSGRADHSAGK